MTSSTQWSEFSERDRKIAEGFSRAAKHQNLQRLIFFGGLHPCSGTDTLSPHLKSREEVGRILLHSGVPTIVLQAGVIVGAFDIGGPDILRYRDMMQVFARIAGLRKLYIVAIPFLTPKSVSYFMKFELPFPQVLSGPWCKVWFTN